MCARECWCVFHTHNASAPLAASPSQCASSAASLVMLSLYLTNHNHIWSYSSARAYRSRCRQSSFKSDFIKNFAPIKTFKPFKTPLRVETVHKTFDVHCCCCCISVLYILRVVSSMHFLLRPRLALPCCRHRRVRACARVPTS